MDLSELMKVVSGKRADIEARSGKNAPQKAPPGKSRWRILPGWREGSPLTFYHDYAQHWIKDASKQVQGVFVCEHETHGKDCEICQGLSEVFRTMKAAGMTKEDDRWKMVSEMNAKRVVLVNALRMDGTNANPDNPVLLGLPVGAFEQYLSLVQTRAADELNMLDLNEGRDIIIDRSGTGFDTKYVVTDASKSTTVNPDVLNRLVNIDAYIEAERVRGLSKPVSVVKTTTRAILTGVTAQRVAPAAAGLVPAASTKAALPEPAPSRVIEADEPSIHDKTPAPAAAPVKEAEVIEATPAPAAEASVVDGSAMSTEDLDRLLADL